MRTRSRTVFPKLSAGNHLQLQSSKKQQLSSSRTRKSHAFVVILLGNVYLLSCQEQFHSSRTAQMQGVPKTRHPVSLSENTSEV